MGCGVTKLLQAQQSDPNGIQRFDQQQTTKPGPDEDQAHKAVMLCTLKEPQTSHESSTTPGSLDSDDKGTSGTDTETMDRMESPIRILAKTNMDILNQPSPTATEVKKGFVAFDIPLDDSEDAILDSLNKRPLPRRLKRLQPLNHQPQLTSEMLMEKLGKAEEKRKKALAKWKEQSERRREFNNRRSSQMGDFRPPSCSAGDGTLSTEPHNESCLESGDISLAGPNETISKLAGTLTNPGLDNLPPNSLTPTPATAQTDGDTQNQNNNNIDAQLLKSGQLFKGLDTTSDFPDLNSSNSQASQDQIGINRCASSGQNSMRGNLYLQTVHEEAEDEEDDDDGEDEDDDDEGELNEDEDGYADEKNIESDPQ